MKKTQYPHMQLFGYEMLQTRMGYSEEEKIHKLMIILFHFFGFCLFSVKTSLYLEKFVRFINNFLTNYFQQTKKLSKNITISACMTVFLVWWVVCWVIANWKGIMSLLKPIFATLSPSSSFGWTELVLLSVPYQPPTTESFK